MMHLTDNPVAANGQRRFGIGQLIYSAGSGGQAWRIQSGAVRLDRVQGEQRLFAGLALKGDILGAETLLFGEYSFDARTIADVELEPWLTADAKPSGESLLRIIASTERRTAETLSLRYGEALDRVRQLIWMLAGGRSEGRQAVVIPGLKDMAEITGLTMETVSRAISRMRKSGMLQKHGRRFGLVVPDTNLLPSR
jgi:CRP/FNR family nitrogen fixation transcriptional regulator